MKKNFSTPIEYVVLSRPYLLLKRKKGAKMTLPCPFCGTGHIHGTLDGHRVAHCATDHKDTVIAKDGTVLSNKLGYVISTI